MINGTTARNIVANLFGGAWAALLAMVCVPLYLRFLGAEAFGLVGVLAALQAVFGLFDLGFGATINREMARLSARVSDGTRERDLLKTFEAFYWSLAALVGVSMAILAGPIAHQWLHAQHLTASTITRSLTYIGGIVALQFPFALYQAGLLGRQRQVVLNAITASVTTVRSVGAVLIVWLAAPSVDLFFAWQAFSMLAQVAITAVVLRRDLPRPVRPARVRLLLIGELWAFSTALAANALLGVLLSQTDKLVLTRLLRLSEFGYYTFAASMAAGLWYIINPIASACYPRLTELLHGGDEPHAIKTYHRACQTMAAVLLPLSATVAAFAHPLIFAWTRDAVLADATAVTATLLICGTTLNGLAALPILLGVAAGFPYILTATNLMAVGVIVPAMVVATWTFGVSGAAAVWIALNSLYVVIAVPLVHRRVMVGEMWQWYANDLAKPVLAAVGCGAVARLLMPAGLTVLATVTYIGISALVITLATAVMLPHIRSVTWRFVVSGPRPQVAEWG